MRKVRAVVLAGSAVVAGCLDIQPRAQMCQSTTSLPEVSAPVSYYQDVEPILAAHCVRCHSPGGIGPFALQTYDEVGSVQGAVRTAVVTRHMPPWPPASCCTSYRDDLSMTASEVATVTAWVDQGGPEGTPAPPTPPSPRGTIQADVTVEMPAPYQPAPPPGSDETRCFLLDWPATETRYVTGADIVSTNPQEVHHALVLTASKDQASSLKGLDGSDGKPGWSCPGGLVQFKDFLGGSFFEPEIYDDGTGHEIDPGDQIILTVHFSLPTVGSFVPDQTSVLLQTQSQPVNRIVALSVFDPAWVVGGMPIPPGAPDVVYSYAYEPGLIDGDKPLVLRTVSLHMHERGSRGQIAILRADGSRQCLLQIDNWSHGWQGEYRFAETQVLRHGDRLLVECHFDNTATHQRVVGGVPETPHWLNWGENQEMCVGFVMATQE